jgi:hypothetical protein
LNSKQRFSTNFGPEIFQDKRNNALRLSRSILLCGSNIWTLRKKGHHSRLNFSGKQGGTPFFIITKGMKKFWKR